MNLLNHLTHLIMAVDLPNPDPQMPPGFEKVGTLLAWIKAGGLIVCTAGLIGAGALMAVNSRRGEGGEHVQKIGMALGGVIIIGAAGAMIGYLAG